MLGNIFFSCGPNAPTHFENVETVWFFVGGFWGRECVQRKGKGGRGRIWEVLKGILGSFGMGGAAVLVK